MRDDFSKSTLILLGHGSTQNDDSAKPAFQHAAELRRRGLFADVKVAFWKQAPLVADVLAETRTERAFIVPLFISEGYFTDHAIPLALGFKQRNETDGSRTMERNGTTFVFTKPVGTLARMADVLIARARNIAEDFPFPRRAKPEHTSLFIAGHGTLQNEDSRKSIEQQVGLIRAREVYAEVQPCFLEETPLIADVPKVAQCKNVIVVPFFISDGMHTVEDIPVLLGEAEKTVRKRIESKQPTWRNPTEKHGKLIWYTGAVGSAPSVSELILERVKEFIAD